MNAKHVLIGCLTTSLALAAAGLLAFEPPAPSFAEATVEHELALSSHAATGEEGARHVRAGPAHGGDAQPPETEEERAPEPGAPDPASEPGEPARTVPVWDAASPADETTRDEGGDDAPARGGPPARAETAAPGEPEAQAPGSEGEERPERQLAAPEVHARGPQPPQPPQRPSGPDVQATQREEPAAPAAPSTSLPEERSGDGEMTIDVHVPARETDGVGGQDVTLEDVDAPETCGLDACRNATSADAGEVATPGVEPVALATQDTHVEGRKVGPVTMGAFDAPTGHDLGETPGREEGSIATPSLEVDALCEAAAEACLPPTHVEGTSARTPAVPGQRAPGVDAGLGIAYGYDADAQDGDVHATPSAWYATA